MASSNKTLVIVSCGKKKIWTKQPSVELVKAKNAYISNYFKLCRLYAEGFGDKWLILSGEHGIVEPDSILHRDYNVKLRPSSKFGTMVREQLRPILSKGFTEIVSLCGKHYSDFLDSVLAPSGLIAFVPLRGLRIGERQRQLKKCLELNRPL